MKKVNDLKSKNEKPKTKIKELYECQTQNLSKKIDELEECLRIDRMKEVSNETWKKCEEHLRDIE